MSNRNYLVELAENHELNEVDIACEVYFAEQFVKFTYEDNWKEDWDKERFPSKLSIAHWISDKDKEGAVSKYFEQCFDHFKGQNWQGRFAMEGLKFIVRKLVDDNYVSEKKKEEFEEGFGAPATNWFNNAVGQIINYLMRRLYKNHNLKSKYATKKIKEIINGNKARKNLHSISLENEEKHKELVEKIIMAYQNQPNLKLDFSQEFEIYNDLKPLFVNHFKEEKKYLLSGQMKLVG